MTPPFFDELARQVATHNNPHISFITGLTLLTQGGGPAFHPAYVPLMQIMHDLFPDELAAARANPAMALEAAQAYGNYDRPFNTQMQVIQTRLAQATNAERETLLADLENRAENDVDRAMVEALKQHFPRA